MTDLLQARFNEAIAAGEAYATVAINARAAKHRFTALARSVYRVGQQHVEAYQEMVRSRLPQEPTGPEKKRPFLLLLHALIGRADRIKALPQLSKLAGALEEIDRAFASEEGDPTVEELIEFIQENGGITGLYENSGKGGKNESPNTSSTSRPGTIRKPWEIQLPKLEACVTKVGTEHHIKMLNRAPGEYRVRLLIDQDGIIESILDEDLNQEAFLERKVQRLERELKTLRSILAFTNNAGMTLASIIPLDMLRRLKQLAHPDKHNNSKASTVATQWLNSCRS